MPRRPLPDPDPSSEIPAAPPTTSAVSAPSPATSKRDVLEDVLDAMDPLERKDQVDVLRAAASFYGLKVPMETL